MPKMWIVELKLERMNGKVKLTRSVPLTFSEARKLLRQYKRDGIQGKLVEITKEAPKCPRQEGYTV